MKTAAGSVSGSLAVASLHVLLLGDVIRAAAGSPVAGGKDHLGRSPNIRFGQNSIYPPQVRRDVTTNGDDFNGQMYDYVVVGGGLAGLTVASRLSEDANVTVAVIEAGPDIYGPDQQRFLTPSAVLYQSFLNTDYDWKWVTTPQPGLGGRTTPWPRGKVLGGSSSVNSLYMVRPSAREFDAWGALIGAPDIWGWEKMFAAMKKSESFQEPVQAVRNMVPSLRWNASSHGTSGNIKTGWPAVAYPMIESFLDAVASLGTPISPDPDAGESWGAFLATSSINADNWTRSSARTGYLDNTDFERPNLRVLTGHQAIKVLLDSSTINNNDTSKGVRATGVQYARGPGAPVQMVQAAREVIVSGGTVNSPVLLQHSGIGDAAQLSALGITTAVDLPGVGRNVQDHVSVAILFPPRDPARQPPPRITGDAVTDSFVQSAIAYINITTLLGGAAAANALLATLRANLTAAVTSGPGAASDAARLAHNATYTAQVDAIYDSPVGLVEILLADIFGTVNIQVALQQALSRGTILVTSADPFAAPAIDAGYLAQAGDQELMRAGLRLARRVGAAMADVLGGEAQPGGAVVGDDANPAAWDDYIRQNAGTEYHPSSSCSMLPRAQGGVVGADLRVYGTANLRVVDASIAPFSVSAHLMSATYGIAEIAADVIKGARAVQAVQVVQVGPDQARGQQGAVAGPVVDQDGTVVQQLEQQQQSASASHTVVVSSGADAAAIGSVLAAALVIGRTALRKWHYPYFRLKAPPTAA